MADQYPAYTPPDYTPEGGADYAPAPPAGSYGTDVFGQPKQGLRQSKLKEYGPPPKVEAPDQPTTKRRGPGRLLFVIGLILLCSCIGMTVAAFVAMRGLVVDGAIESLAGSDDDYERVSEWLSWNPETPDPLPPAPADKVDLVGQCLVQIAPGFEVEMTAWQDGYVDENGDFYADLALVRAAHPAATNVWAGIEFLVQSDQMVAENVNFDVQESASVTGTVDAYEFAYEPQWGEEGYSLDTEEGAALWRQIGADWPMAVVMEIDEITGPGTETTVTAALTTWEAYAIVETSPRVYATYQRLDGAWSLLEWEYWYPAEEETEGQTGV